MWTMTEFGFFSIVVDGQTPGNLLVRARVRDDLVKFVTRLRCAPSTRLGYDTSDIRCTPPPADYRWKVSLPAADVAVFLAECVAEIDYGNFKGRVASVQGHERAHVYHDVWAALLPLQHDGEPEPKRGKARR